jgi:glycosyltransferase involved in cell wall biosynthesis
MGSTSTHTLKVGIDAGPMIGRGGISRYVGPLVRALIASENTFDVQLILRRGWQQLPAAQQLEVLAPVTRLAMPDRAMTGWWDCTGYSLPFPRRLWGSFDCYLSTSLMSPVLSRGEVLTIVYDLIPLRLPALFPEHGMFREQIRRVCQRSSALIAISERTKQDLIELMDVEPERIHVVYPGQNCDAKRLSPNQIATVLARHRIDRPYVLYVGSLGPHKNVPTLLRAYEQARLAKKVSAALVLAGGTEWGEETLAVLESLKVKQDVIVTGFIQDEDLPGLYAGAELFVFPSLYEGFGLPVLEAMAYGKAVVVSNGGAIPEVIGGAGICVDAQDVAELAEAMIQVLGHRSRREAMEQASLAQAARFSWETSAAVLAGLMEHTAGSARL